jgi:hypothetical protein
VKSSVAVAAPNQSAPQRAVVAEPAAHEWREQRGGRHGGERERQRRAEQPRERRRQDAVGGRVVPAVPLAVPDREALLAEQVGAEGVGREVDRARLPDQVDGGEDERRDDRRGLPRIDAAPPARSRRPPAVGPWRGGRRFPGRRVWRGRRRRGGRRRVAQHGGNRLADREGPDRKPQSPRLRARCPAWSPPGPPALADAPRARASQRPCGRSSASPSCAAVWGPEP